MTLYETLIAKSPEGVSSHDCPGGWVCVIAKARHDVRAWYHHESDDARYVAAIERNARQFLNLAAQGAPAC
jgi:hypothetical protein